MSSKIGPIFWIGFVSNNPKSRFRCSYAGRSGKDRSGVLLDAVIADLRISIAPLDEAVVTETLNLTSINEVHDRQIVATAIVAQIQGNQIALLTCDKNITASGTVAIVW
jgi:predicted amino acid-binding ACT domain protein